jgi:molybdopterin-binding protein
VRGRGAPVRVAARADTIATQGERLVELSARNQLRGTVKSVTLGNVMAEVVVDVGGQEIASAITRGSAERLGLAEGDEVVAIVKATEVLLGKE